eukprot:4667639-Pyramimonas_sp.AAC.1
MARIRNPTTFWTYADENLQKRWRYCTVLPHFEYGANAFVQVDDFDLGCRIIGRLRRLQQK